LLKFNPLEPPVELYLLRHAIAVERGTAGFEDDRLRPLTEEGRAKMGRIASGMKKLGLEFDLILSSPYVRARETAELTAAALGQKGSIELEPALQADRSPPGFVAKLASKFAHHERVLAVGHEPFLSSLATLLLGLPGGSALALKKGGLCKLMVTQFTPRPVARLDWLLTPKLLRMIAV
jgi:phosphohistidine phosphatase